MNKVVFYIKELGAIRDSKIELSPLMVFSGESGLGKSYASFLVHYLYVLLRSYRLSRFFREKGIDLDGLLKGKKAKDVFLTIPVAELLAWINSDAISYIAYLLGHNTFRGDVAIEFPLQGENLEFRFDEEMVGLDNNEEVYYKVILGDYVYRIPASTEHIGNAPLVGLVKAVLANAVFEDYRYLKQVFLMPTSRGSLVELSSRPAFSSGMYEEFFDNKEDLERPLREVPTDISDKLLACLADVNVGDIRKVDGRMMYYTGNQAEMPVTAAASSVKELAPLTLFFKKYPAKGASILFEEPEAHLHPDRQIKVADLIGCAVGLGSHIQLTTHSDYFIRRLNTLIQLYRLKEADAEKFAGICKAYSFKEECIINPEWVKAYVLYRGEDGYTRIKEQEDVTSEGISFDSFYEVMERDLVSGRTLKKALEE